MKVKKTFLASMVIFAVLSQTVVAYVDPGTGALIIGNIGQLILAFLGAVLGVLLKIFWKPIKGLFLKLRGRN